MTDTVFQNGRGGGAISPWKTDRQHEHERMGTCASIEICQDTDNADQKGKWFLKVHKAYKLLWETYF